MNNVCIPRGTMTLMSSKAFIDGRIEVLNHLKSLLDLTSDHGTIDQIAHMLETKMIQRFGHDHGVLSADYIKISQIFLLESRSMPRGTRKRGIIDGKTAQISMDVSIDNDHEGFFPRYVETNVYECPCGCDTLTFIVKDDGHGDETHLVTINCEPCRETFVAYVTGRSFAIIERQAIPEDDRERYVSSDEFYDTEYDEG